jgi:hypothetical protein
MKAPTRRFTEHKPTGRPLVLDAGHVAVVEGRPLFPSTIVEGDDRPLKPGNFQRKIGSHVVKGAWSGMPIYCLTLPERTTCPRSCANWRDCYGNKMHWSKRHAPGAALEDALRVQVAELAAKHPRGFVVRLHILGDFYSVGYVNLWHEQLVSHPALRIFGYTAHHGDAISKAIIYTALRFRSRWAIRHSDVHPEGYSSQFRTVTIDKAEECPADAIVCPAQTDRTACCGTCALCWSTTKAIAFLKH